jgi:hypothetical protein
MRNQAASRVLDSGHLGSAPTAWCGVVSNASFVLYTAFLVDRCPSGISLQRGVAGASIYATGCGVLWAKSRLLPSCRFATFPASSWRRGTDLAAWADNSPNLAKA